MKWLITVFNLIDLLAYDNYKKKIKLGIDTKKLDKYTEEITGQKINNSMDYFHIYSTVKCYKIHNYKLPDGLDKMYDLLEQISTLMYNEVNEPVKNIYSK